MDFYEPVKLFKAGNRHTRWYLETMEWCSEDIIITSLTIITGQRSFSSLADGLHEKKIQSQKMFLNILFTAKCGKFSLEFCTLSFFL